MKNKKGVRVGDVFYRQVTPLGFGEEAETAGPELFIHTTPSVAKQSPALRRPVIIVMDTNVARPCPFVLAPCGPLAYV